MHPHGMHILNGNGIFYRATHPHGMRNTSFIKKAAGQKSSRFSAPSCKIAFFAKDTGFAGRTIEKA
jgi:hypothetical protein